MKFDRSIIGTRFIFPAVVLAVLGYALYAHVLEGEFIADDYTTVVTNLAIRNPADLKAIWNSCGTRALIMFSFALNYRAHQLEVFGYHLVNILIHVINALLVYWLTVLTFRMPVMRAHPLQSRRTSIAFYAALVFLCHPVQTQAVAYIAQRSVSLAVLFYLLALVLYIKARLEEKRIFLTGAWLAMLLGILCKEMTITLPLTLVVYEFFFSDDFRARLKRISREMVPFLCLSGLLVLIFLNDAPGSVIGLKTHIYRRGFNWHYFLTEINVMRTYLRLLFLPFNQTHHYAYPISRSFFEPATLFSFALLAGVFFSAVRLFRKDRLLSFAIIWFFIATSVEFVVVCAVNRGVLYEHWLYLAMTGFAIFLSLGLHKLISKAKILKPAMITVVVFFSALTYLRNFVWQNEIVFWEDVVRKAPRSALVYLGSGTAYQRKGFNEAALDRFSKGLRLFYGQRKEARDIDMNYLSRIYNNTGLIFNARGMRREALKLFQAAVKVNPHNAEAYHNLAKTCLDMGRYREAIFFLREELHLAKNDPDVYYGLGLAFLKLNEREKSGVFFERARQLHEHYGNTRMAERLSRLLQML